MTGAPGRTVLAGAAAAPPPAGQALGSVLDLVAPLLRRSAAALWRADQLRERYLRYLVTMHTVIRASVPLMELALARCRGAGPEDPVRAALGSYLPVHIAGELHHDDLLVRDMTAAGLHPERELARPPAPEVARLVGAQYYWINHHHPLCLLGYVAVLELNAPSSSLAPLLARRTGLPPAAFGTLRLHAEVDAGHSAAVLTALDEIAAPAALRHAVQLSALHTVSALVDVLDALASPREGRPRIHEEI